MSQSSDAGALENLYAQLAIVFLVLTLVTCICTVALLTGTVSPPGSLAPSTDVPAPTMQLRPSPVPATDVPLPTPGQ